ncbi:MAG: hypothetical protein N4A71_11225 [Carboxylicivirga sp.]|jgi:hypothetical protein|nr:hypothetical protein [Carboxylicivirga sp.]
MKHFTLILLIVLSNARLFAQVKKIWLPGQMINQADSKLVSVAQIASYKMIRLFAADALHTFHLLNPVNN